MEQCREVVPRASRGDSRLQALDHLHVACVAEFHCDLSYFEDRAECFGQDRLSVCVWVYIEVVADGNRKMP